MDNSYEQENTVPLEMVQTKKKSFHTYNFG